MKDISDYIDCFDMPICPLCDNAIYDYEPYIIVSCHDVIGLVHLFCLEEAEDK